MTLPKKIGKVIHIQDDNDYPSVGTRVIIVDVGADDDCYDRPEKLINVVAKVGRNHWGTRGLVFPYDIDFDDEGDTLYKEDISLFTDIYIRILPKDPDGNWK